MSNNREYNNSSKKYRLWLQQAAHERNRLAQQDGDNTKLLASDLDGEDAWDDYCQGENAVTYGQCIYQGEMDRINSEFEELTANIA